MDRRRRVLALVALVVLSSAVLGVRAMTASPGEGSGSADVRADGKGVYPGHTLITVQSYDGFRKDNGQVLLVNRAGETVWRYDPPHAWVFDAELLRNGNVLVSMAESGKTGDCPAKYTDGDGNAELMECVHNRVVEVDFRSKDVVWEYSWYDAFPTHHEVHDADRLPSGETAIIDMGNNRAFTVNRAGNVTWMWRARNHISEGTEFWKEYVPEDAESKYRKQGPESDWTHMNDIDRLANGNFQLSIRNFDVVLEVDPGTNEIVDVIGRPGDHTVMNQQHNPMRIEGAGTMLVADSEGDRVVEVDVETGEVIWSYDGTGSGQNLDWPRDADRLPNGNTLLTDSLHSRVLEVSPNGTVVWEWSMEDRLAIVYEADRVYLPDNATYLREEPDDVPSGRALTGRTSAGLPEPIGWVVGWVQFYTPLWVGPAEAFVALVDLVALGGLGREGLRHYRDGP